MTNPSESWRPLVPEHQQRQLSVLWGKSDVGGEMHLLIQHMFDSLAVGELMWDRFLSPAFRRRIDRCAGPAGGRALFGWLCGVHDIGKATPAFQSMRPDLGEAVERSGLTFDLGKGRTGWRHDKAGASHLVTHQADLFGVARRSPEAGWLWPLVGGHHGSFPALREIGLVHQSDRERKQGVSDEWNSIRNVLLNIAAIASGHESLGQVLPFSAPSRGEQLAIAGYMVMADWIASSKHLSAVNRWESVSSAEAGVRAEHAWSAFGLTGGWRELPEPASTVISDRFGHPPRAVQQLAVDIAQQMSSSGLMIVEAPMGEGKTQLALAVAEVLAHRFGFDGVAFALPTQATCDPVFRNVKRWLDDLGGGVPLALLHGKRVVNSGWADLVASASPQAGSSDRVDMYGDPIGSDPFGIVEGTCEDCDADDHADVGTHAAASWFLGKYRGLLSATVVGTIDQLLFAATRTKFVSLRFCGLAGKVVVIDEVHAADAYMTQFLDELLWWLGSAGVPVILMSATLSPTQRSLLAGAYAAGMAGAGVNSAVESAAHDRAGYPQITVVDRGSNGEATTSIRICDSSRAAQQVSLRMIEGSDQTADAETISTIRSTVGDGGVALVLRNTVGRAQSLYEALASEFGSDVVLLHSRFTASDRDTKTRSVIDRLGPSSTDRPHRMIVVATQVAEQSFDVDADILFTDLAPVDLLLQRIGRLHRHDRVRPAHLAEPVAFVTAMPSVDGGASVVERGAARIYGEHHLLRAATLVRRSLDEGWVIPANIPTLIDAAYGSEPPMEDAWREAANESEREWAAESVKREAVASVARLVQPNQRSLPTLAGLMGSHGDAERNVHVRDIELEAVEVVLVHRFDDGYATMSGKPLGMNGEIARDDPALAVGAAVKVTDTRDGQLRRELLDASEPPAEWQGHPWLGQSVVLVLNEKNRAVLPSFDIRYSSDLGLAVDRR